MSSGRWSTLSLLTVAAAAAALAFHSGRLSVRQSSTFSTELSRRTGPQPGGAAFAKSIHPDETKAVLAPKLENFETHWAELSAQRATPSIESEMAALVERMAVQDPQRAISLAAAQANLRLRAALLRAVLKGWGTADPEAAVQWAQTETVMDQAQAIAALLQGAVQNPDKAVSVTAGLIQNDSSRAVEFGNDLISALNEAGQFERAADFAISGAENCRDNWMLVAYSRWAEFQPQAALASARQLTDGTLRDMALNAIIVGWAPNDPKGLLEFAQKTFSPEQQNLALPRALEFWASCDPAAAATWLNQNNPGPASDLGVAEIALSPQLLRKPDLAANWAESIVSPRLRSETLNAVIEKWAAIDLSGAESYVNNSPYLTLEDRKSFDERLRLRSEP